MDKHISDFVPQLTQLLLETIKDQDEEVVSNSAFALGVLAESGRETTLPYPIHPYLCRNDLHKSFMLIFCYIVVHSSCFCQWKYGIP